MFNLNVIFSDKELTLNTDNIEMQTNIHNSVHKSITLGKSSQKHV